MARNFSSGSSTTRAVPSTTTERKFTEWCMAARASTSPSTRVAVTHTGRPDGAALAASIGPLPVEPCR